MRCPEEWPSRRSNPADRIRLTGPAATKFYFSSPPKPKGQRRPADASAYFPPPAKTEVCLCDGVDPLALAGEARLRSLENRSGNKTAIRTNDVSKTSQVVRRFPTNPDP